MLLLPHEMVQHCAVLIEITFTQLSENCTRINIVSIYEVMVVVKSRAEFTLSIANSILSYQTTVACVV